MTISRRAFLRAVGLGAGSVAVAGTAGLTWRAVDQGVFAAGTGPAYAAWDVAPSGGLLDIVAAAVLAPNAHNAQPWLFELGPERIDLYADPARGLGTMDPLAREMHISLGCALENAVLAAPVHGRSATVTLLPDPADAELMARIAFAPGAAPPSPLAAAIPVRHTDRTAYDTSRPLPAATLDALAGLVAEPDTGVVWITEPARMAEFGALTVRATEAIIADPQQVADDAVWYRESWRAMQASKDGITLDSSGLPQLIRAVGKLVPTPQPVNNAAWLAATRDTHVPTAAAFGVLVAPDPDDVAARLRTGRLWQRMHLWATLHGLAAQPLNQAPERADRERTTGAAPDVGAALAALLPPGRGALHAFRLGFPTATAGRSPRRPAAEVLRTVA